MKKEQMSQAGNFLQKVLFLEPTYSSYLLIIRDRYLTGHLFCSLVHEPASPSALLVNCGMLLDIKPHETHAHCQLFTGVSKSMSVKLEQVVIVFCRWGSFFTQVELFLLAKNLLIAGPELFRQDIFSEVNAFLFLSTWQTQVPVISAFYRNSFRSSGYECSRGEGGGKHIFYSSVCVQLSSVSLHQLFTSHLQLATHLCMGRQPSA